MKECQELGKVHQISHDKDIDKCIFCHKTLEEIEEGDPLDKPDYSLQKIGSEV